MHPVLIAQAPIERPLQDNNFTNLRCQHVYEPLGAKHLGVRENAWNDKPDQAQSAVRYELSQEAHREIRKETR